MARDSLTSATNDQPTTAYEEPHAKPLRLGETNDRGLVQYVKRESAGAAPTTIEPGTPFGLSETRAVSRALARNVPQEECDALFAEHGTLVDKLMAEGNHSQKERARLAYVRWQLDRIEDARIGEGLDALEKLTQLHETISAEVASFVDHVKDISRPPRRKSR
jgi:hypothetical protein